jgi:ribonuclease P/MRP protein subunit POP5
MKNVPVRDGKSCVFRVVRVSGTMRKAQEEAIRRARDIILKAQRGASEKEDGTLDSIFGKGGEQAVVGAAKDVLMVDGSNGENEDEDSEGLC